MSYVTDPDDLDRFQVAIDPILQTISLRGLGTERHAVDQTGDSDGTTTFTDAGANFTSDGVVAGDVLTIISDPADDGGIIGHYRVVTAGTTTLTVERNIPASTAADLTYKINAPEATGGASAAVADGVDMQALYSFLKEEWITLGAGLGNAVDLNRFNFPMRATSSAAGQYVMGGINGDASSDWAMAADNGVESTDTEGTPRELVRSGGWQEVNASDRVVREYPNYTTLGSLDTDAQVYFQQGDETGDPVDFKLTGPVNQSYLSFGPDVGPDSGTGFDIDNSAKTISRNDGGNWASDNYRVGDYITISNAEDSGNDGSYGPITAVDDSVDGDITIPSATWTTNTDDQTVIIQVDHRRYNALRVRKKGRSYAIAVDADAGIPSSGIVPVINKFPLAHANDPATNTGEDGNDGTGEDDGTISGGNGLAASGDFFQETESYTTGSDGAIPSAISADGTFTFTSAGSTFDSQARGVDILRPGDSLEIESGTYQGVYEIKTIDSSTVLTLYAEPGRTYPGVETTLDFTCRTGVRDVGSAVAALADVDGDTGTLTDAGATFNTNTALGDRQVVAGDIVELFSGAAAHIGYYKVDSVDSDTVLTLDTSDQIFTTQSNQSYRIWRPGMFLQRFETLASISGASTVAFNDADPDTIGRTGGSFVTDGFLAGMALTVVDAEDAGNIGNYIIDTAAASLLTLIAEESLTANADDTTASQNGNMTGDSGIVRTINQVDYPFHWRLFANGATLDQAYQFVQRELRRATDIDGGNGTERGDITDALMTYVSPNGVTLDMYPDDLASAEANNTSYVDISGDTRNNAFLVGITFVVNSNLIGASNKRLTAYFTSVPSGDFDTNDAIIVDDVDSVDMDWTTIAGNKQASFDYTNNSQGGRTPDTDAPITVVALGDDNATHVLVTETITKVNALTITIPNLADPNYSNP
jgi:hypothetical protein